MLQGDEYIIKFEEMYQKQQSNTWVTTASSIDFDNKGVGTPQESWKKFILDKISK
jgi:hypothetical protein